MLCGAALRSLHGQINRNRRVQAKVNHSPNCAPWPVLITKYILFTKTAPAHSASRHNMTEITELAEVYDDGVKDGALEERDLIVAWLRRMDHEQAAILAESIARADHRQPD
jgi:hypothetical protein